MHPRAKETHFGVAKFAPHQLPERRSLYVESWANSNRRQSATLQHSDRTELPRGGKRDQGSPGKCSRNFVLTICPVPAGVSLFSTAILLHCPSSFPWGVTGKSLEPTLDKGAKRKPWPKEGVCKRRSKGSTGTPARSVNSPSPRVHSQRSPNFSPSCCANTGVDRGP